MTIDAVITWVDGDDPVLAAKRSQYISGKEAKAPEIAGATRFASIGEINWCIASINKFAPWIRKIYIVTDGQNPQVEEYISEHFEKPIPMEIVDHKDIFRGYEQHLPTFNSCTITTMLWRIPGISDHFILFNDDVILGAPTKPTDFFSADGSVICHAKWLSTPIARYKLWLKEKHRGYHKFDFSTMILNSSEILGHKLFFPRMHHTPHCVSKEFFERFFSEHPDILERNIQYKFRNQNQFSAIALQYMALLREGKCKVVPHRGKLLYIQPRKSRSYMIHKLHRLAKQSYKFYCFNSLETAIDADRRYMIDFISKKVI